MIRKHKQQVIKMTRATDSSHRSAATILEKEGFARGRFLLYKHLDHKERKDFFFSHRGKCDSWGGEKR